MLAWSPSGTELACTFYHDHPQVISVNRTVETVPSMAHAYSVCWSPDDRFLAMSINDENNLQAEIRFCDRNSPRERQRVLSFDQPEPVRGFDWSRKGLFALWLKHKLLVYDLSRISREKQLPEPAYALSLGDTMFCDQLTTLRWSPDGEWLAAGSNNGQIVCWQPHTGKHFYQQPVKKNIRSISWSPGGRKLVIAFANKQVLFWNLQTKQVSEAWLPEHPRMVSISPQTGQVAVATEEMLFFFERFGALAPATRHPSQLYAAFSADDKLATLDRDDGTELTIWQI
jgi:WD40 repeat protein